MGAMFRAVEDGSYIIEQCNRLERVTARAVVRRVLRDAMRPVLADAKALAPKDTGSLADSLSLRAIARTRRGVGVLLQTSGDLKKSSQKRGFRVFSGEHFYGSFVHWGHRFVVGPRVSNTTVGVRFRRKRSVAIQREIDRREESRTRGRFPGIPFLKEAGDANRDRLTRDVANGITEAIAQAVAEGKGK